jgi:hypothetical protein
VDWQLEIHFSAVHGGVDRLIVLRATSTVNWARGSPVAEGHLQGSHLILGISFVCNEALNGFRLFITGSGFLAVFKAFWHQTAASG